jgi:hypothetical protein
MRQPRVKKLEKGTGNERRKRSTRTPENSQEFWSWSRRHNDQNVTGLSLLKSG